jgi:hypothetical protein
MQKKVKVTYITKNKRAKLTEKKREKEMVLPVREKPNKYETIVIVSSDNDS